MDIDLRKEIGQLIKDTGHYVLLHRTSRKFRCICWDEKMGESNVEIYKTRMKDTRHNLLTCPKCLGQGWVGRIERVKCRRQNGSDLISLSNRLQSKPVGVISYDNLTFFFEHDVRPREGDYIYEVGWIGDRPTHIIAKYQIFVPIDLREKEGRIEFWAVSAKESKLDDKVKGFTIKNLGKIKNYEILR